MTIAEAVRLQAIKPSPSITISTAAKAMQARGEKVVDLSLGEPDFPTPPHIVEAAYRAMRAGETRYTAPDGTPALKDAVVEKFRRENGLHFERSNITCANGAKQVIYNALVATLEPGDEVICPAPYWVSYTDMTLLAGGKPKTLECSASDNFKLTPEALERAITPASRWLFLNSPSNPSGAAFSRAELVALGDVIARHPRVLVLSDEIYEHIYYAAEPFTSFATACPNLIERTIIVNGVSKTYAMTGWRIGYAAVPAALARIMSKVQSQTTGNPSSVAQAAAVEALIGPQDFVATACSEFLKRRDLLMSGLQSIEGIELKRPDGAFYLYPDLSRYIGRRDREGKIVSDDTALANYVLNAAKVACVQGAAFGLSPYLRFSYAASQDDLSRAVESIRAALVDLA